MESIEGEEKLTEQVWRELHNTVEEIALLSGDERLVTIERARDLAIQLSTTAIRLAVLLNSFKGPKVVNINDYRRE